MRNLLCALFLILAGCRAVDSEKSFSLSPSSASEFTDFTVCDIDNDGKPEIAVSEWSEQNKHASVSIYARNESGAWIKRYSFDSSGKPLALTFGDFDSDGITDIAYIEYPWFFNLRTGSSHFEKLFRDMNQNQWATSLAFGKLRKKGISDFLCGPVWRCWNKDNSFSSGYFGVEKGMAMNGNSVITDTDSDGNPDVIFYKNYIRILYGPLPDIPDMKMKNSMAPYYAEIPSPASISALDFEDADGDKITDIVALGESGGLMVFRQHLHGFDPLEKPMRIFPDATGAFCFYKNSMIYSDGKQIWRIAKKDILLKYPEKRSVALFDSAIKISVYDIDGDKSPELLLLSKSGFIILSME